VQLVVVGALQEFQEREEEDPIPGSLARADVRCKQLPLPDGDAQPPFGVEFGVRVLEHLLFATTSESLR